MRTLGVAMMMGLAAPAAAASGAEQFDLVCKIGSTTIRYRVDLAAHEACEGGCERVWRTGAITSGEIRLRDVGSDEIDDVPQTITVNRVTGEWRHWIGGLRRDYVETGKCEPGDFSGFPARAF